MSPIRARSSWSFDSSGVSKRMFGPCTKVEGPVRAKRPPFSRASTQTRQRQPGRGIVAAPPEPRISTFTRTIVETRRLRVQHVGEDRQHDSKRHERPAHDRGVGGALEGV